MARHRLGWCRPQIPRKLTIKDTGSEVNMTRKLSTLCFVLSFLLLGIIPASGTERLCDVSFEDCRAPLLKLIQNETVEIDVAFWFMDDAQISNALIKKFQAGVPVRILMDPRSDEGHPTDTQV